MAAFYSIQRQVWAAATGHSIVSRQQLVWNCRTCFELINAAVDDSNRLGAACWQMHSQGPGRTWKAAVRYAAAILL